MKVALLNVNGLTCKEKIENLKDTFENENINILFLLETHPNEHRIELVRSIQQTRCFRKNQKNQNKQKVQTKRRNHVHNNKRNCTEK